MHEQETWQGRFKDILVNPVQSEPPQLIEADFVTFLLGNQEFVEQLQKQVQVAVDKVLSLEPTRGSVVYDKLNKQMNLEGRFMHKFVVIDVKSEKLVAVADTIQQAYQTARAKSKSRNLYFRKIGRDYLFRA